MTRIVIAGVPRAGKTTLANHLESERTGRPCPDNTGPLTINGAIVHTDDFIRLYEWSRVSEVVAEYFDIPGPWIIEGVRAVHALRKWLAAHPKGRPCDRIIWLGAPRVALTHGQNVMAKGCRTVWAEVRPLLLARDVHVEEL
jgi:hypothetical protein